MLLALDVYYYTDSAKAVAVEFSDWQDSMPSAHQSVFIKEIAAYEAGAFYKRELPCLLAVMAKYDPSKIHAIVVDGFVDLDDAGSPGLGAYLFQHFHGKIPIIGLAKNPYKKGGNHQREIFRGNSQKPLFVTAKGIPVDQAASHIQNMAGAYRFPDIFKELDRLTKEAP